ncbi:helix-turn-helix domain-containing protein [Streptosporangium longisporum]|uniref:Helix-turn-helix domain-containing protein n=1 Tax=Streptosporangium longisporum TaxID=46187 RepID=A0ABP6LEG6_9ACTN
MTVQHIGMVYAADGGLEANEKHLLGAYCNHTDVHGYCWPKIERLADETGMSVRTVNRVNSALKAKKLIKSVRRFNPRTGEPISNLTRVNLPLLESMKRAPKEYDDNLIEAITFDEEEGSAVPEDSPQEGAEEGQTTLEMASDLLLCQSDTYPVPTWHVPTCQSDTEVGANLAHKTSVETSVEPPPLAPPREPASPESQTSLRNEGGGGGSSGEAPPFPTPGIPGVGNDPRSTGGSGKVLSSEDRAALVAEVRALRPEWRATSITKALEHPGVVERGNPALIRAALLLVAQDEQSQGPGRVGFDGPWWSAAAAALRKADGSRPDLPPRCDDTRHDPYLPADRVLYDDEVGPFPCPTCHPTALAKRNAR